MHNGELFLTNDWKVERGKVALGFVYWLHNIRGEDEMQSHPACRLVWSRQQLRRQKNSALNSQSLLLEICANSDMELLFNPHPDYSGISPSSHLSALPSKFSLSAWLSSSCLDMITIHFIRVHEFNIHTCGEAIRFATSSSKCSFVFLCDAESAEPPRFVFFYLINPHNSFRGGICFWNCWRSSTPPVVIVNFFSPKPFSGCSLLCCSVITKTLPTHNTLEMQIVSLLPRLMLI